MAKARQIVKRRKAVTNIRKITRTMQLIATARFQQAYNRAVGTKPYTEKITKLVEELSAASEQVDHPLLRPNPRSHTDVVLIITSNRGLCGGYNGSVLRTALGHLDKTANPEHELHVVGKKGIAYFRFLGRPVERAITTIDDRPRFEQIEPIAMDFIRRYEAGELGEVHVASMRFLSTSRQMPVVVRLLPLSREEGQAPSGLPGVGGTAEPQTMVQYDFSPPPEELLKVLLPQTVKARLFQCFMDAAVSEQTARMVAMKAATDAASDMIKLLSRQFNRARQTQITLELLDIVGGAEALK